MIPDDVENHVITFCAGGEIFLRIVDHAVSTDFLHHFRILPAADRGYVCAERFRDLDGKGSDAA